MYFMKSHPSIGASEPLSSHLITGESFGIKIKHQIQLTLLLVLISLLCELLLLCRFFPFLNIFS